MNYFGAEMPIPRNVDVATYYSSPQQQSELQSTTINAQQYFSADLVDTSRASESNSSALYNIDSHDHSQSPQDEDVQDVQLLVQLQESRSQVDNLFAELSNYRMANNQLREEVEQSRILLQKAELSLQEQKKATTAMEENITVKNEEIAILFGKCQQLQQVNTHLEIEAGKVPNLIAEIKRLSEALTESETTLKQSEELLYTAKAENSELVWYISCLLNFLFSF